MLLADSYDRFERLLFVIGVAPRTTAIFQVSRFERQIYVRAPDVGIQDRVPTRASKLNGR
jgi:ATP-dependent Zn protease